jgi:hypothetical protein
MSADFKPLPDNVNIPCYEVVKDDERAAYPGYDFGVRRPGSSHPRCPYPAVELYRHSSATMGRCAWHRFRHRATNKVLTPVYRLQEQGASLVEITAAYHAPDLWVKYHRAVALAAMVMVRQSRH